jgi:hypothetical protein
MPDRSESLDKKRAGNCTQCRQKKQCPPIRLGDTFYPDKIVPKLDHSMKCHRHQTYKSANCGRSAKITPCTDCHSVSGKKKFPEIYS